MINECRLGGRRKEEVEEDIFFSVRINTRTQQQQKEKGTIKCVMRKREIEREESKCQRICLDMFWFSIIIIRTS